jgi:DNA polymerase
VIAPPPALADLRYGTQLRAGLGVSTVLADCDFETYSEAGYQWDAARNRWGPLPHATKRGIQAVGAFRYAEHPTTEVLCFGYDLKDGLGRRQWRPGMPFPDDLRQHIADGKLLEAWNVQFEMAIWEAVCAPRLGWPVMPRSQWRCAMGKARAFALPGKLEEAAKVLGTAAQKMTDGKRLLNLFSVPRNPTKDDPRLRRLPEHDPAGDGQRLYDYNLGDIETEAEISSRVPDLEGEELEWWHVDLDINARGVHLDVPSVEGCAAIVETALAKYNAELAALTGGVVESASQVQRLREWMASRGYSITSLDEERLTFALKDPTLPPDCLRPLQIRELIGSASVKKLFSMRNQACADGNLRGLFKYHAARTGRTTGADVQPTNLPSGGPSVRACGACGQHYGKSKPTCPWCYASAKTSKIEGWSHRAADDALLVARSGSLAAFEMFFDDALPTISGCLRGLFVARPGHELICSDYSAIEAVALAELAGEEWRKEVFRGHGKIYEASAAKTFGVPLDDILRHKKETGDHHPIRKKGKVMELACFGPHTQVLTARGYVSMVDVRISDKLWDGVEWVSHQGVVWRGVKKVLDLDGIKITPTHKINIENSWVEARKLVSHASILSRALATGSESLPFSAWSAEKGTNCASFGSVAAAGLPNTPLTCTTFDPGEPRGVTLAQEPRREKPAPSNGSKNTPRFSPMRNTAAGYLTGLARRLLGAIPLRVSSSPLTADGGFPYTQSGENPKVNFSFTYRPSPDGTTPLWKWTERTSTGTMNREISGSFRNWRTAGTGGKCPSLKPAFAIWKNVYDIAYAGPRNRFTVKTNSGHLIVHNCGYGGWVGALVAFGADEFMTEDEMRAAAGDWRVESPAIVDYWGGQSRYDRRVHVRYPELFGIEGAALNAVRFPGTEYSCRGIRFLVSQDVLYCTLLSGRRLTYHKPRLRPSDRRPNEETLSYEGWNTNPKNGPVGWIRIDTYGPKLVENLDQATCRDIQRHGLIKLHRAGYPTVLHVYDENVGEVPEGSGFVEEYEMIMAELPAWCQGWPIRAAGGWRGQRYRKD